LKNDRQRQEDIARRRLEAMKKLKKVTSKQSKVPDLKDDGDRVTLQVCAASTCICTPEMD